jgi:thiol-disulfide isomerase/thioredoxin
MLALQWQLLLLFPLTALSLLVAATPLYDATDGGLNLDSDTLETTVLGSSSAWLVQYYAHWCGHCQNYVKTWRKLAHDLRELEPNLHLATIDCGDPQQRDVCTRHNITGTPTLKFYPSNATFGQSTNISSSRHFCPSLPCSLSILAFGPSLLRVSFPFPCVQSFLAQMLSKYPGPHIFGPKSWLFMLWLGEMLRIFLSAHLPSSFTTFPALFPTPIPIRCRLRMPFLERHGELEVKSDIVPLLARELGLVEAFAEWTPNHVEYYRSSQLPPQKMVVVLETQGSDLGKQIALEFATSQDVSVRYMTLEIGTSFAAAFNISKLPAVLTIDKAIRTDTVTIPASDDPFAEVKSYILTVCGRSAEQLSNEGVTAVPRTLAPYRAAYYAQVDPQDLVSAISYSLRYEIAF